MRKRLALIVLSLVTWAALPGAVAAVGPHGCASEADFYDGPVENGGGAGVNDYLCAYGGMTEYGDTDSDDGVQPLEGIIGVDSVRLWREPGTCWKFYGYDGTEYSLQYMSFQITSSTYGNWINLASFLRDDSNNSYRLVKTATC